MAFFKLLYFRALKIEVQIFLDKAFIRWKKGIKKVEFGGCLGGDGL